MKVNFQEIPHPILQERLQYKLCFSTTLKVNIKDLEGDYMIGSLFTVCIVGFFLYHSMESCYSFLPLRFSPI